MTCPHCAMQAGRVDMACLGCCARLVKNARPSRERQEGMFAVIAKYEAAPTKQAIIEYIRESK